MPIPRDGYGNLEILLAKMPASFSHIYAAMYAGLGTIGFSHNVVTPQYGPRVRFVSVFTAAEIPGDPVFEQDLCKSCRPGSVPLRRLRDGAAASWASSTRSAARGITRNLVAASRWPCGVCLKVCPIGEERKLCERRRVADYLDERDALAKDVNDPQYHHLTHLRTHGSRP